MNFFSLSKLVGAAWYHNIQRPGRRRVVVRRLNLGLELLESRTVPSTTALPAPLVSNPTSIGGGFSPQVVIDPLNPLKMVEVHSTGGALAGNYTTDGGQTWSAFGLQGNIGDPNIYRWPTFAVVQSPSVSFDLNEHFYVVAVQHDTGNTSGAVVVQSLDFSGSSPTEDGVTTLADDILTTSQTVIDVNSTVGFPMTGNFTIVIGSERMLVTDTSGGTTWVVTRGIDGTIPAGHNKDASVSLDITNNITSDLGDPHVLYRWYNKDGTTDVAYNPVVAVDTHMPTYTDPVTGQTQTDSMAAMITDPVYGLVPKAIYVAWNVNERQPSGAGGGLSSKIMVEASGDGGHSYSTMQRLGASPLFIDGRGSAPNITFTQATADGANQGGLLTFFWSNGSSVVMDQSSPDGGVATAPVTATQDFTATNPLNPTSFLMGITDGIKAQNGPDITGVTTSTQNVSFTAANLTTIKDLDVTLNLVHAKLDELSIYLTAPDGTTIELVANHTNNDGTTNNSGSAFVNFGLTGANIGDLARTVGNSTTYYPTGLVFDQEAARQINDTNASAEYVGHFKPEARPGSTLVNGNLTTFGGNLSQFYGMTAAQLSGTWTLTIDDHRNSGNNPAPFQQLANWSLHFTGLISTTGFGPDTRTKASTVPSSASNTYATTGAAYGAPGVGPDVSVAIDNTLGGLSPYQGRIYMVYTGGGGSNTNVYLIHSDDNGANWSDPQKLNDDSISDNFSEGNRAQFQPTVAVDPVTGTVVVSYFDARNDAANARVANAIIVSTDGGDTFSPVSYANVTKTATDFLTGKVESYGPIPGNQTAAGTFGFGDRQGLVIYGGNIIPVYSTNLNSGGTSIYTATVTTATGPRVTYGDMGPLTQNFTADTLNTLSGVISYNNTFATDGTRQFDGFVVTFDRPVDIASFTTDPAANVKVKYKDPNTGVVTDVVVGSITPLDAQTWGPRSVGFYNGTQHLAESFLIRLQTPQTKVGTYSYSIGSTVRDNIHVATTLRSDVDSDPNTTQIYVNTSIGIQPTPNAPVLVQIGTEQMLVTGVATVPAFFGGGYQWTVQRGYNGTQVSSHPVDPLSPPVPVVYLGNQMDQYTVGGIGGVDATAGTKTNVVTGGSDENYFANPAPVNHVPFSGPYDLTTLPLIIPGPYVLSTSVVNTADSGQPRAATSDNLVLNDTNSAIDVTFDRDIDPTTFTKDDIISMIGPAGEIAGPFTVTQLSPTNKRTFRIGFPKQTLSGTYTVNIGSDVKDTLGNKLDSNFNAGLDLLRGFIDPETSPNAAVTRPVYNVDAAATKISQLNGMDANAATTQVTVASNAGFPQTSATGPFVVIIDKEQIRVTDNTTTTWTIERGYNGTAVTAHANSTPITQIFEIPTTGDLETTITVPDSFIIKPSGTRVFVGSTGTATSLNADIVSATVPTLAVKSNVGFPTSPFSPFVIQIGTEQMQVTAVNGLNWTVTRGFNNTVATTHKKDDPVVLGKPVTIELELDISYPKVPDLSAKLISPTGQVIQLFQNVGNYGSPSLADFQGTVFDDAATNPIQSASTPIRSGPFNPQTPLTTPLDGTQAMGTWKLVITNNGTTSSQGALTHWELRLPRVVTGSGLGETVADRTSASFRIFTQATDNSQSSKQWTPVGPAAANVFTGAVRTTLSGGVPTAVAGNTTTIFVDDPVAAGFPTHGPFTIQIGTEQMQVTAVTPSRNGATAWAVVRGFNHTAPASHFDNSAVLLGTSGANAGRIGGLAVDPSDPSGNTVYVAGASGGVWKTSNFLTTDPNGPTYVQLTDLGPSYSLNVGSLAVFGRNNDPNQTVIFAATGEGETGSPGVGLLRSMDGGRTWQVLDGKTNANPGGTILPLNDPLRTHEFLNTTAYKVVVDPTPRPTGIVVYAALSGGSNPGLWRSIDSGNTWSLIRAGNATDVVLAPASRDANGNASILYAAFQGEGVYISTNPLVAATMDLMTGGKDQLTRTAGGVPIPTNAPSDVPNGNKGRIVLATPAIANDPLKDLYYQGWLYAAVVAPNGTLDGVYLTKDFGNNWTKLRLPTAGLGYGTNDEKKGDYNVLGIPALASGNYDTGAISFAIDPNNPNITYLGGTRDSGNPTGVMRIDATLVDDPYTLSGYSNDENDGGTTQFASSGPTTVTSSIYGILDPLDPSYPLPLAAYRNLYRTPNNPFSNNATLNFSNVSAFTNTGTDVRWMPFDGALGSSTDQHEIIAVRDPLTGGTRLIFGDSQGVWTGVDRGDGTLIRSVGSAELPSDSRNGNLQIAQFNNGASQPSTLAGELMQALFYGQAKDNGSLQSPVDVLTNGNVTWTGPYGDGAGVATDQTGTGTVYQYNWPCCNNGDGPAGLGFNTSDFFVVTQPNLATTGRTTGLIQNQSTEIPDPTKLGQPWPYHTGSNFAVNPYDGSSVVMSSQTGRLFITPLSDGSSDGYGIRWKEMPAAAPKTGGSYAAAVAFGAPIPASGSVSHGKSDFIYAGTQSGKVIVTFDRGGTWTDISAGLDTSAVQQIVTNPKSGTYEAYAVTLKGVYWMKDSHAAGATWVKIDDLPGLASTTLNTAGAIVAADPAATTLTVADGTVFPPTPFVIQVDQEQMKVTAVSADGTTLTVARGYNLTQITTHADGATVQQVNPLFGGAGVTGVQRPNFNNPDDPYTALQYLTTIQADWRFAIPDDPGTAASTTLSGAIPDATTTTLTVASSAGFPAAPTPQSPFVVQIGSELIQVVNIDPVTNVWTVNRGVNGTTAAAHDDASVVSEYLTHPVLYIGGEGGVFRSTNKGKIWTNFPDVGDDGAPQEGGYLPTAHVTELNLVLGNVDTTTGFADPSSGLNLLLATTYGRGAFAIRLDNSGVNTNLVVPNSGPQVDLSNPTVGNNGLTFTGYTVTFKGNVDPSTFQVGDVTVTGPNGNVVVASVTDVTNLAQSGGIHTQFQITFQNPQTATGNYTLTIGPDVRDGSGNLMDQNANNTNGESGAAPGGDAYTNVYNFTQNTPPTISNTPPYAVVQPNATTDNVFTFTAGDAETPNQLTVSATSSNQSVLQDSQISVTGSGANYTITFTPGSVHGFADVTLKVVDADGLFTTSTFRVYVDQAPTFNFNDPSSVPHGTGPLSLPLGATDPDPGDQLQYTVTLSDPLYDLKTTYGLTAAPTALTIGGQNVWLYKSSNGSNPGRGHGGAFILTSDNKLYAWQGSLPATIKPAFLTADFLNDPQYMRNVFAEPTLIPSAAAPISIDATHAQAGESLTTDPADLALLALRAKYGLTNPATGYNLRGAKEFYFRSTNGSNAAFGGVFVLMPNNTLLAWRGAIGNGVLVADFAQDPAYSGKDVYHEPALLSAASDLLVDPAALALYDVKVTFGLTKPATTGTLPSSGGPQAVRVFRSTNGSNSGAGRGNLFILNSANQLYAWAGSYDKSVAQAPVAKFTDAKFGSPGGIDVFTTPGLLTSATNLVTLPSVIASVDGTGTLTINPPGGFEGNLVVTVTVSDILPGDATQTPVDTATRSFNYTVTNGAPTLGAIADQTSVYGSGPKNVTLPYDDSGPPADNSLPAYRIDFSDALYDLKVQYGVKAAPTTASVKSTNLGAPQKVWFYKSSNGFNAAHGGNLMLTSDNKLYAWQGNYDATAVPGNLVADIADAAYLGINLYAAPNMLPKSQAPVTPTVGRNRGPLYDVKFQYGLNTPATLITTGGQTVWLFRSSNGSNGAYGGSYVLTSNGMLYAWQGSLPASTAQPPVANLSASAVWSNPALLTGARPVVVQDALYDLKEVLGLTKGATTGTLPSSGGPQTVRVFRSANGSNAGAGHANLYILNSLNQLYAWAGSYDKSVAQAPVVTFSQDVYANPVLLTEATGQEVAVTTSYSGTTLTLTPNPVFAGTVRLTVTASDGAEAASPPQSFLFTVANAAPSLPQPANQTAQSGDGSLQFNLGATDGDGTLAYYPVQISGNPLADLAAKYKLTNAATQVTLNSQSGTRSVYLFKASNGALYILASSTPGTDGGQLYAWKGSYDASVARPPVADFNTGAYNGILVYQNVMNDPSYLANQTQPSLTGVNGMIDPSGVLTISWPSGFTGTFAVTVTVGDGASEVQRSFLVTVS